MNRKYLMIALVSFSLTTIVSCGGGDAADKEKTEQEEANEDDAVSEDEFEKEMQELDEDVKNMSNSTDSTIKKTMTIEKKIEDGKKMVEEKTIEIKKEVK